MVVQKSLIKSSSNLQEPYHLGFTCQHYKVFRKFIKQVQKEKV